MKIAGILFFIAAFYYFGWFLVGGQTGSLVGFINLLVTGFLFFNLIENKQGGAWFSRKKYKFDIRIPISNKGYGIYILFISIMLLTTIIMATSTHSVSDFVIGLLPTLGLLVVTLYLTFNNYAEK